MVRLFRLGAALLAVVAVLGPANAQQAPASSDKEKKICRTEGPPTGSIMGQRRVCRSKAEWIKIEEVNRRNTDQALAARRINNGPTGN